jgi:tetratricopeptide (TPR) repeat protein/MFS family permease
MQSTRLSAYCAKVIEGGWIAAVVLVPLYFNVYSSRVFEPDKLTLLRSIAVFMAMAWLVKVIEEASHGSNGSAGSVRERVLRISWRTPLVLVTLALVVIYLFTTLTSVTRFTSLWGSYQRLQGTYTTLSYIVIFLLILNEMHTREQLDRLITAAIITSVPISLYGLIQHYGIDPLPWGGDVTSRVAANMGNAIFVAAYMIMIFFLTLGRIVESFIAILTEEEAHVSDILRAAAYIFAALIQLITIWFSQSRGPWVGLMVGAFAFVLFGLLALRRAALDKGATTWSDVLKALGGTAIMATVVGFVALLASRRTWKWLWLSWVLLAILGASFLVLFNLPDTPLESLRQAPYIGRLGRIFETDRSTGKVRVLIWEGVVEMITPHEPLVYPPESPDEPFKTDKLNFLRPLIGYGPESMYVAYNPFYPSDLAHYERRNASPDRSHNETFDALVITGGIGLVGYMMLFGSIFYFGLKWLGWIEDARQKRAFLTMYLLLGVLVSALSIVIGGPEFFGVGLPFGFTMGLVLYSLLYALFRHGVERSAFVLFWGIITLLGVGIAALAESGLVILLGALVILILIGIIFYGVGRSTFGHQEAVEEQMSVRHPILILSLLVAIIAHFVEIHFGIAIAATRTYFWVFSALLVLLGTGLISQTASTAKPEAEAPTSPPTETAQKSRRKRRQRSRRPDAEPRRQTTRPGLPSWIGPVLTSAFILTLIMGTLGFDFITNAGRISIDPSCDPQSARMLQPCWTSTAWNILEHDLTVLPANRNQGRPEETNSLMTLGLFLLTLLIGSVVTLSEMARRGLFRRAKEDSGWAALLLVSVAIILTLVVTFSIADWHLQFGRVQIGASSLSQRFQETRTLQDLANLVRGLLNVTMYLSSILVTLYAFVFLFVLSTGLVLLLGQHLPKQWATPWGAMAAVPLFFIALFVMNQTNIKIIRADVIYKEGERWSQQQQWDLAIAHHKRALELAPNEDFYYLWAGSAYLEKSKLAPTERCIITEAPNISGVLNMSVETTAQLCREDLLTAARTILLEARHVNPLNTDHSANLGRLYKNWADLSTDSEERAEWLDQSISYYKQAATLSPQNTIVWNELATVYLYQIGDMAKAWETIERSLKLDDRFDQTHMIAGDAWLRETEMVGQQLAAKQQELSTAEGEAKAAIEAEIAQLQEEQDRKLEAAITSYERALEINPGLMNVYVTVAGAYEQLGRIDEAIATFENAAISNPKSADPYIGLAELYQRNNSPEAAVEAYRQAIALKPNDVNYRLTLASLLESLGRLNEALTEVQEAARLKPEDPSLRQNLAFMYERLQMYPEALAEAQVAAQLAPNDTTPQLLVGDISRVLDDLPTAAGAYERALAIDPNLENAWNVHLNLALIYQGLGQLDLALTHATAALSGAPETQREQISDFVAQLETQSSGNP